MTRVLVLGGCGAVGSVAARTLAGHSSIAQVVVGDVRVEEAETLVDQLGAKAVARRVDALDPGSLGEAIAGCDLVLNCTGPFYKFIQENISREWGPSGRNIGVRAVVGRWDPLGKDEVIAQWTEALPQLEGHVQTFEGVGHFIEEVKPEVIGEAVLEVCGLK